MNSLKARCNAFKEKNLLPPPDQSAVARLKLAQLTEPGRKVYLTLETAWEKFKVAIEEPDAVLNREMIQTFFWWYVDNAKGIINLKPTMDTLLYYLSRFSWMCKFLYQYEIPETTLQNLRDYIKSDLAKEFDLQYAHYDKEVTDFVDLKIVIRYIVLYDKHEYNDRRFRAQLVCIFLLIAEDGGRLGAIAQSSCYRETNSALLYRDVQFWIRPSSPGSSPYFKLQITFNNRKNEVGIASKFFVQTYFSRSDLPTCAILWFLALAFLDDVFQDYATPAELFRKRNLSNSDIVIRIKAAKMAVPLFRRTDPQGGRKLSPDLPWSTNVISVEGKRIFCEAGFRPRFTFYGLRRGVSNEIADSNVPAERRKQTMGHHGSDDAVFTKYYQSKISTLDSGNIFRKEDPRPEKRELLCMRSTRDPNAPLSLPKATRDEIFDADEKIQDLLKSRRELQGEHWQIENEPSSGCNRVTIVAALEGNWRALRRRRETLSAQGFKKLRDAHFLLAETSEISLVVPWDILRPDLAEILYPEDGDLGPPQLALERIIVHCNGAASVSEELFAIPRPHAGVSERFKPEDDQLLIDLVETKCLAWKHIGIHFPGRSIKALQRRYKMLAPPQKAYELFITPRPPADQFQCFESEDDKLLIDLRGDKRLPWDHIKAHFPGRSSQSLKGRYSALKCKTGKSYELVTKPRPQADPKQRFEFEDDELLIDLKRNKGLTWDHVKMHFPGRSLDSLQSYCLRLTRDAEYTLEESELLVDLKDQLGYTWKEIAARFPDRSVGSLKTKYFNLTYTLEKAKQLVDLKEKMEQLDHETPRVAKRKEWTAEEIEVLVDLKEQTNFSWKRICAYFPGRNALAIKVKYSDLMSRKRDDSSELEGGTSPKPKRRRLQ